jgi:aldehyde dehydrogenase (NAD+)
MRTAAQRGILTGIEQRRNALDRLQTAIESERDALTAALAEDLGKSAVEAWTTEIGFTLGQITHARRHLVRWSKRRRVPLKLQLRPGRAQIAPTPLGTVCVIAPWNYPVQLVLAPIVAALAAGNTVVAKPSEVAPATEAVLARMLRQHLSDVIGVVTGGAEQTSLLLAERFDHIFYTGNGRVGRIVMKAASEHLTPVTLELGGKSPAIVTDTANIRISARRIAWGKFINAGQTCVAPDHVLVFESVADEFVEELRSAVTDFFGADPLSSPDYGRIINTHHHQRLTSLLPEAGSARIVIGGHHDVAERYIAPTVIDHITDDSPLMDDEIFGPILPIVRVADLDDAIERVRSRPHPLALYLFSNDDSDREVVLARTSSGGVLVNHTLLHLAAEDLPFGGVGESGMGAYHGQAGFDVFSHLRPVMERPMRPDPSLLYPPYGRIKRRLLERLL